MKIALVTAIANAVAAYKQCQKSNNPYADRWAEKIHEYNKMLPCGSGYDRGSSIDVENSTRTKLVIKTSFHHLDPNGFYTKWTLHTVRVTPHFGGIIQVDVTNDRDCYISEHFNTVLNTIVEV